MLNSSVPENVQITQLKELRSKLLRWFHGDYGPEGRDELRSEICQIIPLVKQTVMDSGCMKLLNVAPPPAVGGVVIQNQDPFDSIFTDFWGFSVIPDVVDMIDSTIGVLLKPNLGTRTEGSPMASDMNINAADNRGLHPWPVVLSLLFERPSDEIVEILSLAGLQAHWALSAQENFSDKTRKRAYRQRVDLATRPLSDDDRLRLGWIVTSELIRRNSAAADVFATRLASVGWSITPSGLSPGGATVHELFLRPGQVHDAYVEIRKILGLATTSLDVVDPWIDASLLGLLATCHQKGLGSARLLSCNVPADFTEECKRFREQYPNFTLLIRKSREFHDRFLVLDGDTCYHVGASIKDAGRKAFMISRIEDETNSSALIRLIEQAWNTATSL